MKQLHAGGFLGRKWLGGHARPYFGAGRLGFQFEEIKDGVDVRGKCRCMKPGTHGQCLTEHSSRLKHFPKQRDVFARSASDGLRRRVIVRDGDLSQVLRGRKDLAQGVRADRRGKVDKIG